MMLAISFLVLAVATALGIASRAQPQFSPQHTARPTPQPTSRLAPRLSWLACAAASVILVITGARGLAGHAGRLTLGTVGELGAAHLQVDALSGLFLVISFGVAVPVTLAGLAHAATRPRLPALVAATLAAVAVIVTADNFFVFLFGWEALTFTFYLFTGFDRARRGRAWASLVTGVFGKTSGSALLIAGALLAGHAGSFTIADFGAHAGPGTIQVAYALLLVGFFVKIGLVPAQVWMPDGYGHAAPAARAVMAGVAVNVGYYGLWRTLDILGAPPTWLVVCVLALGGITAIIGIAHAAVHAKLPQLVAWSSVENAGVITAGFGVALLGAHTGHTMLVAAGLVAATAQICAHALGKSLLFISTAALGHDLGTVDLDTLRGTMRRAPFSGVGITVGAWTLAGLPLAAGFASEWLTLEALMQQFRVTGLALHLAAAAAGVLVALTIGVASVTFVRLIGFAALGPTPPGLRLAQKPPAHPAEKALGHRSAVVLLAVACLGFAAIAPLEIRVIATGLTPLVGNAAYRAAGNPWVLQPVYDGFSALSPSWLWIVIPGLAVLIIAVGMLLSGGRMWRMRRVPAWASASPGVGREPGYTSYGFANPMRTLLTNVLLTRHRVGITPPGSASPTSPRLRYRIDVTDIVARHGYRPAKRAVLAATRLVARLQSGHLGAYLAYMLIVLIAVIAVAAAVA